MGKGFREDLMRYNDLAKKQMNPEITSEENIQVTQEIYDFINGITGENLTNKIVEHDKTNSKTQLNIYTPGREEQNIITWLKNELKKLDQENPPEEEFELKSYQVFYRNDKLFFQFKGRETPITLGEIITDLDWDIYYQLDPQKIPRAIKKRYLIEIAKNKIRKYLDKQTALNESSSQLVSEQKRGAYKKILFEKEMDFTETLGHITERVIIGFLRKISIDHDLDFEIVYADPFQDVEQCIDFIVLKKKTAPFQKIGIQITTNRDPRAIKRKKEQIARAKKKNHQENFVDDIILVQIDTNKSIMPAFKAWKDQKGPGGPDRFLSIEDRRKIFSEVLRKIFEPVEIEGMWRKVEPALVLITE